MKNTNQAITSGNMRYSIIISMKTGANFFQAPLPLITLNINNGKSADISANNTITGIDRDPESIILARQVAATAVTIKHMNERKNVIALL